MANTHWILSTEYFWSPGCARLRNFGQSSLCFKKSTSRLNFLEKNIPKNLTFGFKFCIFVVLKVHHRLHRFPQIFTNKRLDVILFCICHPVFFPLCHPEWNEGSECIHVDAYEIFHYALLRSKWQIVLTDAYHTLLAPLERGIHITTQNS